MEHRIHSVVGARFIWHMKQVHHPFHRINPAVRPVETGVPASAVALGLGSKDMGFADGDGLLVPADDAEKKRRWRRGIQADTFYTDETDSTDRTDENVLRSLCSSVTPSLLNFISSYLILSFQSCVSPVYLNICAICVFFCAHPREPLKHEKSKTVGRGERRRFCSDRAVR